MGSCDSAAISKLCDLEQKIKCKGEFADPTGGGQEDQHSSGVTKVGVMTSPLKGKEEGY
jgi:hypothetical protein